METKSSQPLPPVTNNVVLSRTTDVRKLIGPTWPFGSATGMGGCVRVSGSNECCMTGSGNATVTPALVPAIIWVDVAQRAVTCREELLCCLMIGFKPA